MQQYQNIYNFQQEEESMQQQQQQQQLSQKKKLFEEENQLAYQEQYFGIGEYRQQELPISFDQQDSYKSIDIFFNDDDNNKFELFDGNLNSNQQDMYLYSQQGQQVQEFIAQNQLEIFGQFTAQNKDEISIRVEQQQQIINLDNHHVEFQQNFQFSQLQQHQQILFDFVHEDEKVIQKLPKLSTSKKIKRKSQNSQKDMFKTKNIPKVFGNAFRNYVSSNSSNVQQVCSVNNVNFKDFNNFVKKLNFYSIKGMREAFQQTPEDPKLDQLKKIYRILVNKFLREDTWTWFLSNKRISNCRRLCNFRFYILRGLSCPAAFISWED